MLGAGRKRANHSIFTNDPRKRLRMRASREALLANPVAPFFQRGECESSVAKPIWNKTQKGQENSQNIFLSFCFRCLSFLVGSNVSSEFLLFSQVSPLNRPFSPVNKKTTNPTTPTTSCYYISRTKPPNQATTHGGKGTQTFGVARLPCRP